MADPVKYYEDYISKKEGKGKWVDYWVVIRGCWMLFYSSKNISERSNFCGSLELSKKARYSVGKRRNYSFPFYVSTPRGSHLFKCSSNLKRHQWMYALGLAIKGYPPVPPPSFVPRVTIKDEDGDHIASWETNKTGNINNGLDVQDDVLDDDDDDDESYPHGVIFVSTLPDDLKLCSDGNNERERLLNMMNKNDTEDYVPSNAVLCTGITGTTSIVHKRDLLSDENEFHLIKPLINPVSRSTGSIKEDAASSEHLSLSSSLWLEERPSTSPFPSAFDRSPLAFNARNTNNLKFSRHMTNSAPDVKTLGLRTDIRP